MTFIMENIFGKYGAKVFSAVLVTAIMASSSDVFL